MVFVYTNIINNYRFIFIKFKIIKNKYIQNILKKTIKK
jgi:hypothetical protein